MHMYVLLFLFMIIYNNLIVFVFASLVEYATVNFIYNKDKRSKKKRRGSANSLGELKRTQSASSFKSFKSSDSLYSTLKSNLFLKVSIFHNLNKIIFKYCFFKTIASESWSQENQFWTTKSFLHQRYERRRY